MRKGENEKRRRKVRKGRESKEVSRQYAGKRKNERKRKGENEKGCRLHC